jgi:hypothetical protein
MSTDTEAWDYILDADDEEYEDPFDIDEPFDDEDEEEEFDGYKAEMADQRIQDR